MAPGVDDIEPVELPPTDEVSPQDVPVASIIYISVMFTLLIMCFVVMWMKIYFIGQKTRSPQQRRMYVGSRARPSLGTQEPTIYVSPSNLPPPPKYECMAPPSYEEVVGVHYPNYQVQQPIAQPIATALAQPTTTNDTRREDTTVVNVNERPTVTS